jgi:hypothetical protein
MGRMSSVVRYFILIVILFSAVSVNAQWDTPAATDTTKNAAAAGGAWGDSDPAAPEKAPKVPYVRFYPPYDTMREIIFYENAIDFEDCDLCSADSLYWRAKKFLIRRYGSKSNLKKMILSEKPADHITLKVTIPLVVVIGKYSKGAVGMLEYKVSLRFKDSRYKYQFGNFVHIQTAEGLSENATKTYFEYYLKVKKGYEITDRYLIAADAEVKNFIEKLSVALKQPYKPDEEDW